MKAEAASRAFAALGVGQGETVAVLASNMVENYVLSFGAYGAGVVVTPFFPTSSASEVEFMLKDSAAKVLFIGGQRQYDVALPLYAKVYTLRCMVLMSPS